jgi:hypothetical protein
MQALNAHQLQMRYQNEFLAKIPAKRRLLDRGDVGSPAGASESLRCSLFNRYGQGSEQAIRTIRYCAQLPHSPAITTQKGPGGDSYGLQ